MLIAKPKSGVNSYNYEHHNQLRHWEILVNEQCESKSYLESTHKPYPSYLYLKTHWLLTLSLENLRKDLINHNHN